MLGSVIRVDVTPLDTMHGRRDKYPVQASCSPVTSPLRGENSRQNYPFWERSALARPDRAGG